MDNTERHRYYVQLYHSPTLAPEDYDCQNAETKHREDIHDVGSYEDLPVSDMEKWDSDDIWVTCNETW